jgi:hypothetical protein
VWTRRATCSSTEFWKIPPVGGNPDAQERILLISFFHFASRSGHRASPGSTQRRAGEGRP